MIDNPNDLLVLAGPSKVHGPPCGGFHQTRQLQQSSATFVRVIMCGHTAIAAQTILLVTDITNAHSSCTKPSSKYVMMCDECNPSAIPAMGRQT